MLPVPGDTQDAASIALMEGVLTKALDPNYGLTPGQFHDVMEMFITLMHLRKVSMPYWIENISLPVQGMALARGIHAEASLLRIADLPESAKKTLEAAIDLSMSEISGIRTKMIEKLAVIKQMPMPHVKLN